jgi:hypothetical protein
MSGDIFELKVAMMASVAESERCQQIDITIDKSNADSDIANIHNNECISTPNIDNNGCISTPNIDNNGCISTSNMDNNGCISNNTTTNNISVGDIFTRRHSVRQTSASTFLCPELIPGKLFLIGWCGLRSERSKICATFC